MKFKDMLAFGIIIWLFGTGIGAWMIHQSNRNRSSERIQQLQDTISLKNEEIQSKQAIIDGKQDKLTEISDEILELSKKLDTNTVALNDISREIKGLTSNTNKISRGIQNEQKEKGEIKFNVKDSDYYSFHLGGNTENVAKKLLANKYQLQMFKGNRIPIFLQLKNNTILISTALRDIQNELIVEFNQGEWALNKANNFSINYDESGLEIIDKRGLVNLQIDILNNNLYFKGILYFENTAMIFDEGIFPLSYKATNFLNEFYTRGSNIKRIFKHTGTNYLGERNDD